VCIPFRTALEYPGLRLRIMLATAQALTSAYSGLSACEALSESLLALGFVLFSGLVIGRQPLSLVAILEFNRKSSDHMNAHLNFS